MPLLAFFARVPERWRTAAIVACAFLLLVAACGVIGFAFDRWLSGKQAQAIRIDRADASLDAAERTIAADRTATANQTAADAAFQNSQEALRDEVRTKGTDAAVGPATAGVLERLRREQAGAARHDPAR
ncbi:hypothetical protein [Sphingomonas sp. 1P08PE]|uniref:hypothetical protein n=1 Tax=Sphingomonas sp. 1P08PE TaxID=554122 RepID=UPI0039A39417